MKKDTGYVIEVSGGIGKHIMATSFVKWINDNHPEKEITVISACPYIFEYNPRIHRNLILNQPYLFEDYIKNNDFRKGNPYELKEYYRSENKKHLMELFPKAYMFGKLNENPEAEIYLTRGEEAEGNMFCNQNNPIITMHFSGGLPPGSSQNRMKIDSSQRDMPLKVAYKAADILTKKGFKVLQLRSKNEPQIPRCLQIDMQFRNIIPIVKNAIAHIGIDSSWMHIAGCFKKPMLTFWGGTHKDNLGYNHEGSFHAFTDNGMHNRPSLGVHDRFALYPFKDKKEGLEMDFTDKEIENYVQELLDFLDSKSNSDKEVKYEKI